MRGKASRTYQPGLYYVVEFMTKQNTKLKGDIFEAKVFDYIRQYVLSGNSFLNPKGCRFYKQKGYYSKDRESDIKVDISIESYANNAENWSLLIVVECKNYSNTVPVDDLEEFVAKLDQISGKNVKGIFFTTIGFQKGALSYAKSKGIALVRILPEDEVEWELRRVPSPVSINNRKYHIKSQIVEGLLNPDYIGQSEFLFGCVDSIFSTSLREIINAIVTVEGTCAINELNKISSSYARNIGKVSLIVPFLGQTDIEHRASNVLDFFKNDNSVSKHETNISQICNYLTDSHNVSFIFDEDLGEDNDGTEILGKFSTDPLKIFITNRLVVNSKRWRFTLAHELGHLVLHRNYNLSELIGTHQETIANLAVGRIKYKPTNLGRLEWQANAFASSLLLPIDTFISQVLNILKTLGIRNSGHGIIFLDEQQCNIQTFKSVLTRLKFIFNVSKEAIEYRLSQLRLLNDQRKKYHISYIIKNMLIG